MTADLLIIQLLEAVEVGDGGVYLKPDISNYGHSHTFEIIHPVHGYVGYISGNYNTKDNSFNIRLVNVSNHPNYKSQRRRPTHPDNFEYGGEGQSRDTYSGMSRTFVRAALRSLRQHIPNLETITGDNRVTGTHAIAKAKTNNYSMANTSVRIPKSIRKSV